MAEKKSGTGEPGSTRRGKSRGQAAPDEQQRELLRRIRRKEGELEALAQEARAAAETILEQARREAETLVLEARAAAGARLEREAESDLGEVAVQAREILEAAAREAELVGSDAAGKLEEAARLILDALLPAPPGPGEPR